LRERERLEVEAREEQELREMLETRKIAKEKLIQLTLEMAQRKKPLFKGGFSISPIEPFNKVMNQRKIELNELGNEVEKRAANNVQLAKIGEILKQIDNLDLKIKLETKVLKKGIKKN